MAVHPLSNESCVPLAWQADGSARSMLASYGMRLVGLFQLVGDLYSAVSLGKLLSMPEPPVALVIGFYLTTIGLVAGSGGLALLTGREALTVRFRISPPHTGSNTSVSAPLKTERKVRVTGAAYDDGWSRWVRSAGSDGVFRYPSGFVLRMWRYATRVDTSRARWCAR
jgi:hypothetical protein